MKPLIAAHTDNPQDHIT